MGRRWKFTDLIRHLTLVLCFAAGTTAVWAQEIGLQLYSLRNQLKQDVPGTLDLVVQHGFRVVEGGDTYGLEDSEFVALLQERGLRMVSLGATFEDLEQAPDKVLKRALLYGADFVMCPWIPHRASFDEAEARHAIKVLNRAGDYLSRHGKQLLYHPHGYELVTHGEGTLLDLMFLEARHFDFELDVFWIAHGGGDPLHILTEYGDKVRLLHLKDMRHGTEGNLRGRAEGKASVTLGTGQIPIREIYRQARIMNLPYVFIEDESPDVLDQLARSLEFLRD